MSDNSLQFKQRRQYLLHNRSDVFRRQRAELDLLKKIVEVLFEQPENKAWLVLMLKTFVGPDKRVSPPTGALMRNSSSVNLVNKVPSNMWKRSMGMGPLAH